MAKKKAAKGLNFDAVAEADARMMKGVEDWPPFVGYGIDLIDKALVAFGKPPIDRSQIKGPGEYFDDLVADVKASKPTSIKAQFIKAAAVLALDYLHKFIHPEHVGA